MREPSFTSLAKDLAVFFGVILAFILGFLVVSYVVPPTRTPGIFAAILLGYMYAFSKFIGWMIDKSKGDPGT
jgi:hypothetical protein